MFIGWRVRFNNRFRKSIQKQFKPMWTGEFYIETSIIFIVIILLGRALNCLLYSKDTSAGSKDAQ